jgi:uncharacterized membrane protein
MDHGNWFSGMGLLMWFVVLGIPAVLGIGVYLLLTQGRGFGSTPQEELQRRYAQGDISREEYEHIKSELKKD